MTPYEFERWARAVSLTEAEREAYDERVAICTAEGIPEERAHEIARQQARPTREQLRLIS